MKIRILLIYSLLIISGCASVVSPDGGKKDELPPVITNTSPDSAALNFNGTEIIIRFDEYITLTNAQQEWVISPSPEKFPEIKKTNNQLKIKLLDSLIANTTYTINTANSIADLNEGNVLNNYRFVFSTGNFIDSLKLTGSVSNAYSNQPQPEISIMLYDTTQNIYSGSPKYLTKSNKEGNYVFYNLPHSTFLVCAWNDKNKNKKPEADEDISIPTIFQLNSDSLLNIELIPGIYRKQGIKKYIEPYPGIFSFITEKPIYLDSISVSFKNFILNKRNEHTTHISATQDTIEITIPYAMDVDSVSFEIATLDTTYTFKTAVTKYNDTFKVKHYSSEINLGEPINIDFTLPISRVGNVKIINNKNDELSIVNTNIYKNSIDIYAKIDLGAYKLIIPENAIKSIFNNTHIKTDTLNFTIKDNTTTGSLSFVIKDTLKQNIIVELILDYKTTQSTYCKGCSSVKFKNIIPGSYQIKIIYDTNNNGIWDIGDITKSLKAEKTILFFEQYKVKSNWQQNDIELLIPKQPSN